MFKRLLPIALSLLFIFPVLPGIMADDVEELPSGFSGISWSKVVPTRKATFVQFDENSFVDDFAYLAAVPASVFYDDGTGRMYSHPLLYYENYVNENQEELSLNARQGLDYFMEDWMTYTGGLEEIEYINVEGEPWEATNCTHIDGDDPYEIAAAIARHDWSYADEAVVAVVDDIAYGSFNRFEGSVQGSLAPREIKVQTVTGVKQDSIAPQYNDFYVPPEYKYIKADLYWPSVSYLPNFMFLATLGLLGGGLTVPSADPDLQLYCYHEGELMQVAASQNWNILHGPSEHVEAYVYNSGRWKAAIEDIPTKGLFGDRHGTIVQRLMDILTRQVTYYIDIQMLPGEEIEIAETPPFMARNADFELSWSGEGRLGLIILDENDVAVGAAVIDNVSKQTLHLDQLANGTYRAVVVQLSEVTETTTYNLDYSWEQRVVKKEANYLMNAAEGAVLASVINAPLVYVSADSVPSCTKSALEELGVKRVHLIDIDGTSDVAGKMGSIADIKKKHTDLVAMYRTIRNMTQENDVVFTTIDPWTYWLLEKLKPEGEKTGALYIGPAAYTAAHHGCPLIALDMHEELATASVWYTEWWKAHAIRDIIPPVAEMFLCGSAVYEFLDDAGLDEPGEVESIITVAGQFDVGIPWDRTFAGPAYAGRILGTPVDTAYWTCRNAFYPAVIFANPALSPDGIALINGSASKRLPSGRLQILKPSQEEEFTHPVLNSWITYAHRFNERASKYWGFNYTTPSGITPFFDPSTNPIDNNVLEDYGKFGSYYPDMSESEVTPFYLEKGGFDIAYTTNFSATMDNLNRGTIMWMETTHGWMGNTGSIAFWNPYGAPGFFGINISLPTVEPNPWRGYELYLPGWFDG
jgi:hypothetical protein